MLDRIHVQRTGAELARRGRGADDERLQYSLEWGFFTRTQWGDMTRRCTSWSAAGARPPDAPAPIGTGPRPATERTIRTLEDVHAAIQHYVDAIP